MHVAVVSCRDSVEMAIAAGSEIVIHFNAFTDGRPETLFTRHDENGLTPVKGDPGQSIVYIACRQLGERVTAALGREGWHIIHYSTNRMWRINPNHQNATRTILALKRTFPGEVTLALTSPDRSHPSPAALTGGSLFLCIAWILRRFMPS